MSMAMHSRAGRRGHPEMDDRKIRTRRLAGYQLRAEDQVLTDLWAGIGKPARLFTLDTGRLFQETYDVMQATLSAIRSAARCTHRTPANWPGLSSGWPESFL